MAVKVSYHHVANNRAETATHAGGEAVEVEDGHLFVKGAFVEKRTTRPTVAIYAPGKWYSAEVE
ncbi:hypothetical protein JNUCC0626_26505 [Lentzea sp. JNUCC 0626]|uniref:hypothetical protein n=1 Tax=Lentzea sp. JNUCC 0626 TaxID=3367513 RepID=UPI003747C1D5